MLQGSGSPRPLSLQLSWEPSGRWNVTRRWVWKTRTNKKCCIIKYAASTSKYSSVLRISMDENEKSKSTTGTGFRNYFCSGTGTKPFQVRSVQGNKDTPSRQSYLKKMQYFNALSTTIEIPPTSTVLRWGQKSHRWIFDKQKPKLSAWHLLGQKQFICLFIKC